MKKFNFSPKSTWFFFFLSIVMLFFFFARTWILVENFEYFQALSTAEIIRGYFDGMRFDLSISLIFLGVPLIMLSLPIYFRFWYYLWSTASIVIFACIMGVVFSDIAFFKESQFHIGDQLLMIQNDMDFVYQTAFQQFWHFLIILVVVVGALFLKMRKIGRKFNQYIASSYKLFPLKILVVLVFVLFGVFGKASLKLKKTISTSDAFSAGKMEYGNLVLNGAFTSFQIIRKKRSKNNKKHFADSRQALDIVYKRLLSDREVLVDPKYPLLRKFKQHKQLLPNNKKLNIMVVMMESWNSEFIDFFSGKKSGNTPNFDRIARDGISFTNFYPSGGMSLFGFSSILTSTPPISRVPLLGKGLELYNVMRPGQMFSKMGYHTFATQGAVRRSFRFDTISKTMGFDDYFGKEDYPRVYQKDSTKNGWDGEMYAFLRSYLTRVDRPFFGYMFTGTTHFPYSVPEKHYEKFPHHETKMPGFFNTLNYADQELGLFMEWAKRQKWFDDTLFIFVADHLLNRTVLQDNSKIPLVFYAPKLLEPQQIDRLGSQVDIMPTVIDMMGLDIPYAGVGRSLFLDDGKEFFFGYKTFVLGLRDKNGIVKHDLTRVISSDFEGPKVQENVNLLLALEQTLWEIVENNKVYHN